MVGQSAIKSAAEAAEKVKKLKNSAGVERLAGVAEKYSLKDKLSLGKKTEHALELKDTTNKSFIEKIALQKEVSKKSKDKPLWKRGMTAVMVGGFGLMLGRNKETKEIAETTTDIAGETIKIATNEEALKESNDAIITAVEAERKVKEVNEKVDQKWKFEKEERDKDWFKELEKREKKYKKYGHTDAWKEAWKKTEFEVDGKTGEKTKRNFFFRLFAFLPAITKTYTSWRTFEKLKKSGVIDKIKRGKRYKDKVDQKMKEAEEKVEKGLEAKKETFSSVFTENPGAVQVSKEYFKKMGRLMGKAELTNKPEIASSIKKYADDACYKGFKKYGPEFEKMKGFKKNLPGVKMKYSEVRFGGKTRLIYAGVEIIGKSLGAALREGANEGGWARAFSTFKSEATNMENWKDACPIWGTIRSAKRLGHEDNAPTWSKWLDFGLSAGMDIASIVAIAGTLGTATPAILAARAAGGAAVRGGVRKVGMRQLLKQGIKGGEKIAAKNLTKSAGKTFAKQSVRAAGGKWGVRLNLMLTTIGEFFGEDIDESMAEAKTKVRDTLLTTEQKRSVAIYKAVETGGALPVTAEIAAISEKDKKQKEEIEVKEKKKTSAGIFSLKTDAKNSFIKGEGKAIDMNPLKGSSIKDAKSTLKDIKAITKKGKSIEHIFKKDLDIAA